jgi:quinol monooxygenase YgiN
MRTPLLLAAGLVLALACPARAQDKEPEIITRLKKAKIDGEFTLVVLVKVKEGEDKNLLKLAKPCVAASRKEKGCLRYDVLQDAEHPQQFVFFERWKSVKDLEDHFTTDHFKKLGGQLKEIVEGAPRFAVLRKTDKE